MSFPLTQKYSVILILRKKKVLVSPHPKVLPDFLSTDLEKNDSTYRVLVQVVLLLGILSESHEPKFVDLVMRVPRVVAQIML